MKKILLLLIISLITIIAVLALLFLNRTTDSLSDSEREEALSKILGRKPVDNSQVPKGDKEYKGKHISFKYPAAAELYTQKVNNTPIPITGIEYFSFDLDSPRMIFSMEIVDVADSQDPLGDYPSVKLRQLQSDAYVQKDVTADYEEGLLFDRYSNSGFEKTAFFSLKGNMYTISVQGNDKKAVEGLFDKVISSTKFL